MAADVEAAAEVVAFGRLLRRYRLAAGLTQEELAGRAGLSARAISDLERAERTRPQRDTVARLAGALSLGPAGRRALEAAVARRRGPAAVTVGLPAGGPPHNLPAPLTSFVGRARELGEVSRLFGASRLLTLVGAGGCGKTRLAVAAAQTPAAFAAGVCFVDLAPLTEGAAAATAVLAALDAPQGAGSPEAALLAFLRARRALLLLDNCEHLLDACAGLAERVLRGCPGVRILATSREPLGAAGEAVYRVPSLSLPDPARPADVAAALAAEAVQLFAARAALLQPDFAVDARNAAAVVAICRRLDGIPLALELAAARTRVLAPEQLLARLDDRFRLLVGGRTAPRRQQTLRAALDWSHDLLSEPERRLFRRLAAFAGGFTLEAAEAVVGGDDLAAGDVLDALTGLVDKSLVQVEEGEAAARYRLLETMRQYGREKLLASGEADAVYRRHATWYAALAATTRQAYYAPAPAATTQQEQHFLPRKERMALWQRLETDVANLRQALDWFIARREGEAAVRLAVDCAHFRATKGHWIEGREALQRALATPGASPTTRARGIAYLSIWWWEGNKGLATARQYAEDALALALQVGDRVAEAKAHLGLGNTGSDPAQQRAHFTTASRLFRALGDAFWTAFATDNCAMAALDMGDERAADELLAESGRRWRQLDEPWGLGRYLGTLAQRALGRGDLEAARQHLEEALQLWQDLGNRFGTAYVLGRLGEVARAQGDLATARRLMESGLSQQREAGLPAEVAWALADVADVWLEQGDQVSARPLLTEALQLASTLDLPGALVRTLEVLTSAEVQAGRPEQALRWTGAVIAWRERAGLVMAWQEQAGLVIFDPFHRQRVERRLAEARAALGDEAADAALAAGRELALDQAGAEALEAWADG